MSSETIRLLAVVADPARGDALLAGLAEIQGVEVVGVAHNQRAAHQLAKAIQPEVLLVDLMLPSYRSISIIEQVTRTQPQVRILALSPGDPPHDRIILAVEVKKKLPGLAYRICCSPRLPKDWVLASHLFGVGAKKRSPGY